MLFTYKTPDGYNTVNTENIVFTSFKQGYLYVLTNLEYSQKIPVKNPKTGQVIKDQYTRSREMLELYIEDQEDIRRYFNETNAGPNLELNFPTKQPVETVIPGAAQLQGESVETPS